MRETRSLSRRSFTLVEVLLVASLIAVIGAAVAQSLLNGMRIWQRIQRVGVDESAMLFAERFASDLANAADMVELPFHGEGDRCAFATIVRTGYAPFGRGPVVAYADQPGRVEYGFDRAGRNLYRQRAYYGQALKGESRQAEVLITGVEAVSFKYFDMTPEGLVGHPLGEAVVPSVIKVTVAYRRSDGSRGEIVRDFVVPVAFYRRVL